MALVEFHPRPFLPLELVERKHLAACVVLDYACVRLYGLCFLFVLTPQDDDSSSSDDDSSSSEVHSTFLSERSKNISGKVGDVRKPKYSNSSEEVSDCDVVLLHTLKVWECISLQCPFHSLSPTIICTLIETTGPLCLERIFLHLAKAGSETMFVGCRHFLVVFVALVVGFATGQFTEQFGFAIVRKR